MNDLIEMILKFRNERNWGQFHNPKDLVISLNLEASELLELFQWKTNEEALEKNEEKIRYELADVLYYTLLISHDLNIDLNVALREKMLINEKKYPMDKAYGTNKKYTEL